MPLSVTDGERLYVYILSKLSVGWSRLENELAFTGRGSEFTDFFKELIAVNLVGRVVAVGAYYEEKYGIASDLFDRSFRNYMRDYMTIHYNDTNTFYRLCVAAISASKQEINASCRKRITRWSREHFQKCYMCNASLIYDDAEHYNAFTIEHIWPRSYGGDSIEENLLPACKSCNSSKKRHFASWAMPSIQSLIYSPGEEDKRLQEIEGTYKFALHYKQVQNYARHKQISLKRAFLEVGPWNDTRILDPDDICDFFNLSNTAL